MKDVHDLIKLLVSLLRRRLGETVDYTHSQSKTSDLRPRRMLRGALVRAVIIAKGGARTFPTSATATTSATRTMGSKLSAAFGSPDVRATKRRGNAAVDAAGTAGTSSGATKRRNATTSAAAAGENADGKPSAASKQRRAKPIKLELEADKPAVGGVAPDGWEATLAKIKKFRAEGPEAAVDTMGCEKIAELGANETSAKHRRYLTLTSAMLSSQTKDEINHAAMKRLCAHGCTPENILNTDEDVLDAMINPVGFHRRKAQYLRATAKILLDEYDGDIPPSVETLCALPGVGPKMAYLVMNVGWEKPTGICVDVHVHRISERLGWTPEHAIGKNGSPRKKTPEDTRAFLESWLPKEEWIEINPLLVGFGQLTCTPLRPKCGSCPLAADGSCPNAFKESTPAPPKSPSAKKKIKVEKTED